ncbi:hypothetical protein Hanom_Chr06g00481311 [Helianthus anomalus]
MGSGVVTRTLRNIEFNYLLPVGGQAIIHRGCRQYGAKPIKFGHRYNFLMWFKSFVFRELQTHDKGFKDFCDECQSRKIARRNEWVAAKKKVISCLKFRTYYIIGGCGP